MIMKGSKKYLCSLLLLMIMSVSSGCNDGKNESSIQNSKIIEEENNTKQSNEEKAKAEDQVKELQGKNSTESVDEIVNSTSLSNPFAVAAFSTHSYVEQYSDDVKFQTISINDKNYEKVMNHIVNEDNMSYQMLGPFYGTENGWIFVDITHNQSNTIAVGTSATMDIEMRTSNYDAQNIERAFPIQLSEEESYYIILGSKDTDQFEGNIYIPFDERNSKEFSMDDISYSDLSKFHIKEDFWENISNIAIKNITCKVEYRRSEDKTIRIKYNPNYYQVTGARNDDQLEVSISCLADDSTNSRVCTNAICYIPDEVIVEMENKFSFIKMNYCPNGKIRHSIGTLIIDEILLDSVKMDIKANKSELVLPDVMKDYKGQEHYSYDVASPKTSIELELESCSFILNN